ncbi:hypothetical protein GW17_00027200 [Ensete ventricosum]|nr:hypothetical protein GW17_00027200 [Ensete ventricosum]
MDLGGLGLTTIDYNQRISQSQVQASGRSEDDVIGNSPGVRRELAEGIGSLLGWLKGVRRKKTETHQKIVGGNQKAYRELGSYKPYMDPGSNIGILPRFRRCGGARREFARTSPKVSGRSLGTRWEIAGVVGLRE